MRIEAVHRDAAHAFSKHAQEHVTLLEGLGVEGDAHAGVTVQHLSRMRREPDAPNLRQVHLIHAELLDGLLLKGYDVAPGRLGENVTTRGVDLLGLPTGARLRLGPEAVVTVTGLRNPCVQIDRFSPGLLAELLPKDEHGQVRRLAGVMAVVSAGGVVRPGDEIGVELPAGPHRRLEKV